jgi:hypothetical protein
MRRLRSQTGSALVSAVLLTSLMLGLGIVAFAMVDGETARSAGERQQETSFNLSEQLLNAQVYILSRDWPGQGGVATGPNPTLQPYPTTCTTGVTSTRCPDINALVSRFGGADLGATVTWSTKVRDNNSPNVNYYDDTTTQTQPAYDANGDERLWVRAQTVVRGKRRTLVGLVRIDKVTEEMPRNAILAGKFGTNNNGNKVIVQTNGGLVQVRCTTPAKSSCMDYPPGKNQVSPDTSELGYTGGDAMTDDQLQRLRERAIAEGTYWATGCPAKPEGSLVFIETASCAYNNSARPCCNSAASPGVLILNHGTLSLSGNLTFHGLIYAANRSNRTDDVVSNTGTSRIEGGVLIDRNGGMLIGSSGHPDNMIYRPNVYNNVISYANAGIIQNTWRDVPTIN